MNTYSHTSKDANPEHSNAPQEDRTLLSLHYLMKYMLKPCRGNHLSFEQKNKIKTDLSTIDGQLMQHLRKQDKGARTEQHVIQQLSQSFQTIMTMHHERTTTAYTTVRDHGAPHLFATMTCEGTGTNA